MTNIATLTNIEARQPYMAAAYADALDRFRREVGFYAIASDGLSESVQATLGNSAQTVKASAGRIYGYVIVSPSGASNGVTVQVFNSAGPSVGTTVPKDLAFCAATKTVFVKVDSADDSGRYGTAITVACTQATSLSSDPATADKPTVYVVYR